MKLKSRSILLMTAVSVVILGACDFSEIGTGERGSGNLVTESRQAEGFSQIDVGSAVTLDVTVDPRAEHSVTVSYDDNILDNLITRVSGDKLVIEIEGDVNLTGNHDRIVEVTMPNLNSLTASGATGVTVSGSIGDLDLDVSGASRVDLSELAVGDVTVDASGASSVYIDTNAVVAGSASGASNVVVRGNPASVLIETSGAASVDLP